MTVSGVPPPQEASALFSAVFASRVLDVRFSQRLHQEEQLEVSLAHFDRLEGRFQEATVTVRLGRRGVEGIDPPLIPPREFQQALKRFYTERYSGERPKAPSSAGEVPRQVLESLLSGMEGHLGGRSEDVQAPEEPKYKVTDRLLAQKELQNEDRLPYDLAVLGRYHRRRGDFLGGAIEGVDRAAFGFTTGADLADAHRTPNEDALGSNRVGGLEIFAVADAHHGERSSELAVCKLLELFRLGFEDETEARDEDILPFLTNAIVRCHTAILSDLKVDRSMTNLVTAVRKGSRLYWASVSDAFLFRADAAQVDQINRDLGHGIGGRRLSVWLGDKRFRKGLIDSGSEAIHNASFLLATDGIMKHPRLRLQSLAGQLNGKVDLDALTYRISRDYAISGRDNTAFIILSGPQGSGAGEIGEHNLAGVAGGAALRGGVTGGTVRGVGRRGEAPL